MCDWKGTLTVNRQQNTTLESQQFKKLDIYNIYNIMKMFIILDMKKNKIDNFSHKIIVLTSINHLRSIDRDG
jgi:hypothetical protein